MQNKSIAKINNEVAAAKKQALRDPYQNERTIEGIADRAAPRNNSGKITFPADVRAKVVQIFDKFPHQLMILGLYYDGGFTVEEIAARNDLEHPNVVKSLGRAKSRLKKYLSPEEYNSIRRFIGDHKPRIDATQDRHVNPFYNDFVEEQPVSTGLLSECGSSILWFDGIYIGSITFTTIPTPVQSYSFEHPPEKQLSKGSFYYDVKSIETGTADCVH
ncbi:sigma-70 family RNA polymerase sigma factor [Paenibacillus sp. OV219]|uniref:sigma-70 family RNA polymerase sigma factor n=1 Tax=Paenibacillus sp. OV219 TaxID=1884377 RepID=UPI0008C67A56|nr:sigma-70 family RNA polymerase sigma factor [Paenibacillus sp. OV219]SEN18833.1 hypothetical protein SAMN05518847_102369 [Paenibacillus sp. OV219]